MPDSSPPENTPKKTHAATRTHTVPGEHMCTGTDACVQANRHANTMGPESTATQFLLLLRDENPTPPKSQPLIWWPFLIDRPLCENTLFKRFSFEKVHELYTVGRGNLISQVLWSLQRIFFSHSPRLYAQNIHYRPVSVSRFSAKSGIEKPK